MQACKSRNVYRNVPACYVLSRCFGGLSILTTLFLLYIDWQYMSCDTTKPTKWMCAQWRLRSAWASTQSDQSSLSTWRNHGSLATHWAHSEDSDQTGRMPKLILVFAGHTLILLVLSWRGSYSVVMRLLVFGNWSEEESYSDCLHCKKYWWCLYIDSGQRFFKIMHWFSGNNCPFLW